MQHLFVGSVGIIFKCIICVSVRHIMEIVLPFVAYSHWQTNLYAWS